MREALVLAGWLVAGGLLVKLLVAIVTYGVLALPWVLLFLAFEPQV